MAVNLYLDDCGRVLPGSFRLHIGWAHALRHQRLVHIFAGRRVSHFAQHGSIALNVEVLFFGEPADLLPDPKARG